MEEFSTMSFILKINIFHFCTYNTTIYFLLTSLEQIFLIKLKVKVVNKGLKYTRYEY